jgi:hypothetical protein
MHWGETASHEDKVFDWCSNSTEQRFDLAEMQTDAVFLHANLSCHASRSLSCFHNNDDF